MEYYTQQYQMRPPPTHFSIDVECVATAPDHNSRVVAQISLVDQYETVLANLYVKPDQPIVSYLTDLTGLTKVILENNGISFNEALARIRQQLPRNATLVGQNIRKDVEWLGLREGVDFEGMVDLTGLFRVWNARYKSFSVFGQDHVARMLLGWESDATHNAVTDAVKSIRLFNLHQSLQANGQEALQKALETLLMVEPEPSFAKKFPVYDGVCMGNRKSCTCGAPFLG